MLFFKLPEWFQCVAKVENHWSNSTSYLKKIGKPKHREVSYLPKAARPVRKNIRTRIRASRQTSHLLYTLLIRDNFTYAHSVLIPPILTFHDNDCDLASNTDDVLPSSLTIRGDERWGGPYRPSWATDPAGPWYSACPGQPTHSGRGKPKWRFPFSLPRHLQERPEGRGRRWDPSAKGPCHPWHPVPWSQRARGGAGQHRCCPVRQVWQWEDDCGCRQRFFSGWCSFLKERMGGYLAVHLTSVCVSYFQLFHFWTLEIWYCFLSWMGSLPLGCESHPVPVVLSEGGFQILVCQYFAIEFPRPTNTNLGLLRDGRLKGGKGGEGVQASSDLYLEDQAKCVNCVL